MLKLNITKSPKILERNINFSLLINNKRKFSESTIDDQLEKYKNLISQLEKNSKTIENEKKKKYEVKINLFDSICKMF